MQPPDYSVPQAAQRLLEDGILDNNLMSHLPPELKALARNIQFTGASKPSIPINWRLAESISALKALEATMLNLLLTRKYEIAPVKATINTDHASLFFMSPVLTKLIGPDGKPVAFSPLQGGAMELFPNEDKYGSLSSLHRGLATNIYKTKDGRYYHIHGGMNPDPTLMALGLSADDSPNDTTESVIRKFEHAVYRHESANIDELLNENFKQAGSTAWTAEEYFASKHGQANQHIGLYEIERDPNSSQPATWWQDNPSLPSSPKRPLAGLKVVDLTRVIAAPSITRSLAEMGASVMRITSPYITDISILHQDLNWGKWNASLHLKDEGDRETLRQLILEADVVVDGYRPGVMDRLGFGRQDIFELVKGRGYGIIHLRENCYGWHGPWSHRSGWQQISDANCGVSLSYGRAMGLDEAVTPIFPNSDYCTGVVGSTAVLDALIRRAGKGGNYAVDVALNYYSQWLVRSCGTYPDEIWKELWERHGSPIFRHYSPLAHLLPSMLELLYRYDAATLLKPEFFEPRRSGAVGATFIQVKPIAQFEGGAVELKYNVGSRGNGIDKPVWPDDLTTEIVR
ncbi:CoA-transferase family III [Penicillium canariense]|uniref:CoA-transferase family III n=1 Tax=Penicillium canariense TaxID=189055 RepID=A0A9W9LTH1_9EURO|nr:CoA-transferase family III [Penicillium canariense]KAJ5175114.1 CoA-transferase family III [Penicillium canariense]